MEKRNEIDTKPIEVIPEVLVIGAGIAGMQASLDIADKGFKVHLVEMSSSIGGHMAQLDKTFPTLDCSACIITPKMVDTANHPNIHLLISSEVVEVKGKVTRVSIMGRDGIGFDVDDGSEQLRAQAFRGLGKMREMGNVPRVGDDVSVVGSVQITEIYEGTKEIQKNTMASALIGKLK